MITADAVNILRNKKEIILDESKKKEVEIESWQPLIQKIEINGVDQGEFKSSIEAIKSHYKKGKLPVIREVGVYGGQFFQGLKFVYDNGHVVEHKSRNQSGASY